MQNPLTQRLLEKARLLQQTPYITLTAIHPIDRQQPVPSRHILTRDLSQFNDDYERLMLANQLGWGAYIGIAYRRQKLQRYQRGGKRDIVALPAIFADIDRSPSLVIPMLKGLIEPSLVISSGHGVHLYWFLKTPTHDISRAERILKGMAICLDADKTMSSDQIMRLPSTQNRKANKKTTMCSVLMESDQEYELDDFLPYLIFTTGIKAKPIKVPDRRLRQKQTHNTSLSQTLNTDLAHAVLTELKQSYCASLKDNGWYACYCPFGHKRDRYPGDHAYYHPDKGLLNCFGRHGQQLIHNLATQIHIDVNLYGGIYNSEKS